MASGDNVVWNTLRRYSGVGTFWERISAMIGTYWSLREIAYCLLFGVMFTS